MVLSLCPDSRGSEEREFSDTLLRLSGSHQDSEDERILSHGMVVLMQGGQ